MSRVSTFGAFTTARLGIYASQKALDVVGHNIANINTVGYTRQVLDQRSLNLGGADKYTSKLDVRIGMGALVTSVNQLRDPYLDIRYRNELSNEAAMEAKLTGLNDLARYLDEVGMGEEDEGVLEAKFNEFISQVEQLSAAQGIGKDSFDTLVRAAADSLTSQIRKYATDLKTLLSNQEDHFKQDLENVNTILTSIRNLNSTIRESQIYGSNALEQRDERNNLIDELAKYVRINVEYQEEDLGDGTTVEKLVISLAGDDAKDPSTNNTVLVDGLYAGKLSIRKVPSQDKDGNYLDADGKVVADKKDAALVQDPNFGINVGALRDEYGRLMVFSSKADIEKEFPSGILQAKADAEKELADLVLAAAPGITYGLVTNKDQTGAITGYQIIKKTTSTVKDENDNTKDLEFDTKAQAELRARTLRKGDPGSKYAVVAPATEGGKYTIQKTVTENEGTAYVPDPTLAKSREDAKQFIKDGIADGSLPESDPDKPGELYRYSVIPDKDADGNVIGYKVQKITDYVSTKTELTDNTLYGGLQAERELLTEQGEYATEAQLKADPNAATKRGIPYYQKALDTLANTFAKIMNDANTIPDEELYYVQTKTENGEEVPVFNITGKDGNPYQLSKAEIEKKIADGDPIITEDSLKTMTPVYTDKDGNVVTAEDRVKKEGYENYKGGPLFSNHGNKDDTEGINASNISVSKSWANSVVRIVHSKEPDPTSTDNSNSIHILSLLLSEDHSFSPDANDLDTGAKDSKVEFFKGSFQQFFTDNMGGTLATDIMTTQAKYQNYTTAVDELYTDRDAVSGVDLNDEAMNMMQFQKSYTAACRLMTTIDELLDRLINGTGRAGL